MLLEVSKAWTYGSALQACATEQASNILFFYKLSTITQKIPFRVIKISYPKPTQLPWAAKSLCGRGEAVLSTSSRASMLQCRAGFQKFGVCCCGGGARHMRTSFICVNVEVPFAFDCLWKCRSTDGICCCLLWLHYGSYDSVGATSEGKKTNQTNTGKDPPCSLVTHSFLQQKIKSQSARVSVKLRGIKSGKAVTILAPLAAFWNQILALA